MELVNCPNCNEIFMKSEFRDVCPKCWKKEEEEYQIVYKFMRKRENRAATIDQIVTSTGVKEDTVLKFIKKGRLSPTQFPNLGYPCDRCGHIIQRGTLCEKCAEEFKKDLDNFQYEEKRKRDLERDQRTFYSKNAKDL